MAQGKGTVNKVILIGRLGADPELKYTPSGTAVVNFRLATNLVWKDRDGNKKEKTNWHNIVAWRKLAEIIGEWVKKGSRIYIEGRIETRSYEDANGVKKWITEIVADSMEMLGDKGSGSSNNIDTSTQPPTSPDNQEEEDDLPF
ncbi:MAG: single-stranded DNA-binding protein [bacterium]